MQCDETAAMLDRYGMHAAAEVIRNQQAEIEVLEVIVERQIAESVAEQASLFRIVVKLRFALTEVLKSIPPGSLSPALAEHAIRTIQTARNEIKGA